MKAVGDSVRPLVVPAEHAFDYGDREQLSDTPARVAPGGQVTAEGNRANLGGVRYSDWAQIRPASASIGCTHWT